MGPQYRVSRQRKSWVERCHHVTALMYYLHLITRWHALALLMWQLYGTAALTHVSVSPGGCIPWRHQLHPKVSPREEESREGEPSARGALSSGRTRRHQAPHATVLSSLHPSLLRSPTSREPDSPTAPPVRAPSVPPPYRIHDPSPFSHLLKDSMKSSSTIARYLGETQSILRWSSMTDSVFESLFGCLESRLG